MCPSVVSWLELSLSLSEAVVSVLVKITSFEESTVPHRHMVLFALFLSFFNYLYFYRGVSYNDIP